MAVLIGSSGARAELHAQASTSGPASVLPLSATLQGGLDGGGGVYVRHTNRIKLAIF